MQIVTDDAPESLFSRTNPTSDSGASVEFFIRGGAGPKGAASFAMGLKYNWRTHVVY